MWGYDTKMRVWTHFISTTRHGHPEQPSPRYFCSLASLTNGSTILFGDLGKMISIKSGIQLRSLNDMGLLTIGDKTFYEAEDRLSESDSLNLYRKYNLRSRTWKAVSQSGDRPPRLPATVDCFTRSSAVGNKLIAVGRRKRPKPYKGDSQYSIFKDLETSAWMFDMLASRWVALPLLPVTLLAAPHTYQDFVVGSGCFSASNPPRSGTVPLIAMYPRCFAGQYSRKFREESCNLCPKGNYAKEASTSCSKCPSGATTTDAGSVSVFNCTRERGYCNHGDCVMAFTEEGPPR